jgi:hypothetical protein
MADKIPVKAIFSGSDVIALSEFDPTDTTGVADGGTGLATIAADRMLYTSALDTLAATPLTAFGRSLMDDADEATARATLGLGTMAVEAQTDYFTKSNLTLAVGNICNPDVDLFAGKYSGVLTVTNATPATARTYVDPYGVVQYADPDTIRVEKEGWLIEGSSENICLQSEDFSTTWFTTNATVTTNSVTAPDGTTTADTLEDADALNYGFLRQNFTLADVIYTYSVYLKQGTATETSISYVSVNHAFRSVGVTWSTLALSGSGASEAKLTELANGW